MLKRADFAAIKKETKLLVQENIRKAEAERRFNDEVQPPDYSRMLKITQDTVFLRKDLPWLLWAALVRIVLMLGAKLAIWFSFGGRVEGRENLRGVKSAVLVCNHVHNLDNLIVRWGVRGHQLYITVADFNNMKGFLGAFMRAGGCMAFSDSFGGMKNLSASVSECLEKKHYVLYYPEKAMWPWYQKPRPFLDGAFHAAVSNKVPVVPMFIVFQEPPAWRKVLGCKKIGVMHILPPVYMKENLSRKENILYMKKAAQRSFCECYKNYFGKWPDTIEESEC